MRIFLDTRDLIELLQRSNPCSAKSFGERLAVGGHHLVLSPTVVFELAAPIVGGSADTIVTRLLNELESLPVVYLGDGQIPPGELAEAIHAFSEGREFSWAGPFHERFDASIPTKGPAPTYLYIRHSLAEIIFTIAREAPDVFQRRRLPLAQLQTAFQNDRALVDPPKRAVHFREKIRRDLVFYGIATTGISVPDLADWIYASPGRCPGLRLRHEVLHQLRANVGDIFGRSDFGDFSHLLCVPYVDIATLDRRMVAYVGQVLRGWDTVRQPVIVPGLADVLLTLK